MSRRLVTFLVSNNYSTRSYRATVSLAAARALLVLVGLAVVLVVVAILLARTALYRSARLSYLESRNLQLETEFSKLAELRQQLARLEAMEYRYAEMLGIELTPPPVDWDAAFVDTTEALDPAAEEPWGGSPIPSVLPVEEFVVSRGFGPAHPGVDLAARSGTPVRAAADGVVTARGTDSIFGNYLLLVHLEGFETYYAHLLSWEVALADSVRAGQTVGLVGSTGRSTAPHLHFEIRRRGRALDPATMLNLR